MEILPLHSRAFDEKMVKYCKKLYNCWGRCHDIQHNDIQNNGNPNNRLHCDTQHNDIRHGHYELLPLSVILLSAAFSYCNANCLYADCRNSGVVMLNVVAPRSVVPWNIKFTIKVGKDWKVIYGHRHFMAIWQSLIVKGQQNFKKCTIFWQKFIGIRSLFVSIRFKLYRKGSDRTSCYLSFVKRWKKLQENT